MYCALNFVCKFGHQVIFQLTRLDVERNYDFIHVIFKGIEYETTDEYMEINNDTATYTWYYSSALQDMANMVWTTDGSNTYGGWTMEIACADPVDRNELSMPIYQENNDEILVDEL